MSSLLSRTSALRCRLLCPVLYTVLFFCQVGIFVHYNLCLPAFGPRPLFFLGALHPHSDKKVFRFRIEGSKEQHLSEI